MGRSTGAGPLARRRAGAPDAACPGAARPGRRSHRGSRRSSAPSSAGASRASGSRWSRISRRLGASTRSRRPEPSACRPRGLTGVTLGVTIDSHGVHRPILQRAFFDGLYEFRIPVASARSSSSVVVLVLALAAGLVRGGAAPSGRSGVLLAVVLAVGLPLTWYLASPILIRTELVEPEPAARSCSTAPRSSVEPAPPSPSTSAAPTASGSRPHRPRRRSHRRRSPPASSTAPTTSTSVAGTATIIETAPGRLHPAPRRLLRPQRPGPVRLPLAERRRLRRRRARARQLKATDGSSATTCRAGTDPADFASAIIWCKQFTHLFATAPLQDGWRRLAATLASEPEKSGLCKPRCERVPSRR